MTVSRYSVELRAEVSGNTLRGHAAVFGQAAELPGHLERLAPTAFDAALANPDTDVRALLNHDPNLLLGRQSAGTVRLGTDSSGLVFEVDLPDTSYARDLRVLVERGDLNGASFGFVPGEDEWTRQSGRQVRTHTSVKRLVDVSPVTFPAYTSTDVALRTFEFARPRGREQLIRARHRARVRPEGV